MSHTKDTRRIEIELSEQDLAQSIAMIRALTVPFAHIEVYEWDSLASLRRLQKRLERRLEEIDLLDESIALVLEAAE